MSPRRTIAVAFLGAAAVSMLAGALARAVPADAGAKPALLEPDFTAAPGTLKAGDPEVLLDPENNTIGLVTRIAREVGDGDWRAVGVLLLCAAVYTARKLTGRVAFLRSDMGAALLALGVGAAGFLGGRAIADQPITGPALLTAAMAGLAAAGGYATIWVRFLRPLWRKIRGDGTDWAARTAPQGAKAGT